MSAKISLEHGAKYPYDATDKWWESEGVLLPPDDWAHNAARGVLTDLQDRRNIKQGFENVDEDMRKEIVLSLAGIIRDAAA